jgi:predicted nucleic acid-binding protein
VIVISDTTPLNYLIQIEHTFVLRELYGRVIVPQAVKEELRKDAAPFAVKTWISTPPDWLEVQLVSRNEPALARLGAGEREAILLAQELLADALIIDERAGRFEANRRSLRVIGTLGVLDSAAERGLIDLPQTIERLIQTSFRASPELVQSFLDRDAARNQQRQEQNRERPSPELEP